MLGGGRVLTRLKASAVDVRLLGTIVVRTHDEPEARVPPRGVDRVLARRKASVVDGRLLTGGHTVPVALAV